MLPKRLDRKTIYESPWINLYTDRVEMPSGKIIEHYHQLDFPRQGVIPLIVNEKQEICFVKVLRYTTNKVEWEFPAGGIEKNEEIVAAAAREILEETGYQATDLQLVYTFYPTTGMCNQVLHLVFGKVTDQTPATFDTDEIQKVVWLPIPEIKRMIAANEITEGGALLALLLDFSQLMPNT